jgi:16S rRNA processing protein RimM
VTDAERTRLGHLLGPHGVQGAVKLYVLGDPAQVKALQRVYVEDRGWLTIRRVDMLAPGVALHLAGITTREGAETLRGLKVYAADADLPAPEPGVYYYHELRGLTLAAEDGRPLGEVLDVQDMGPQDVLVVRQEGGDALVPLQAPYVVVNLNERGRPVSLTLTADAPDDLLDAGAAGMAGSDAP